MGKNTKVPAVLLGGAIGDALGKFAETLTAEQIQERYGDWDGRTYLPGTHPKATEFACRPGVTTDDTQLSRMMALTLVENRGYIAARAAHHYLEWFQGHSHVGEPRGIGGTLKRAFTRMSAGTPWEDSGERLHWNSPCGTGTAMRVGPLGMNGSNLQSICEDAAIDADITHVHVDARSGSVAMAAAVYHSLRAGENSDDGQLMLEQVFDSLSLVNYQHTPMGWGLRFARETALSLEWGMPNYLFLRLYNIKDDVVGLVTSALLCAAQAETFEQGVVEAILMGGDTDTRASMVGTILGAKFGLEGIPEHLIEGLYEHDEIMAEDALLTSRLLPEFSNVE